MLQVRSVANENMNEKPKVCNQNKHIPNPIPISQNILYVQVRKHRKRPHVTIASILERNSSAAKKAAI